ncbi:MAG: hypothetical protein HC767_04810 [Akkermansiaceae bacterium]|nr:hypothetical protein [Akkermansiaceae bacterium]
MMINDSILWLLQTNDSAYPSGSYAHSFGLEELVESGVVTNTADLNRFLHQQVIPSILHFELPFFAKVYHAVLDHRESEIIALDQELDAWRIPAELRDASRRIGSQRLDILPNSILLLSSSAFEEKFHAVITLS